MPKVKIAQLVCDHCRVRCFLLSGETVSLASDLIHLTADDLPQVVVSLLLLVRWWFFPVVQVCKGFILTNTVLKSITNLCE